jgi:Cu2+-exporting ATPase
LIPSETSLTDFSKPAREVTGFGLEWEGPEGIWRLGRAAWASEGTKSPCHSKGTVLCLEGNLIADFSFREEIRPDAPALVKSFLKRGLGIAILSGDEPERVRAMATALGLQPSCAFGGLTPGQKARLVKDHWPDSALMVGDGANDSLAFDAALCRGTPAVDTGLLEHKADFYLLGRSVAGLGQLFAMSDLHRRATRAVFAFALTYNALAVSASLAGWMNPLVAAVIMPLSSLVSIGLVFTFLKSKPSNL